MGFNYTLRNVLLSGVFLCFLCVERFQALQLHREETGEIELTGITLNRPENLTESKKTEAKNAFFI